jgi:uncharacterized OB-fold protein
MKKVHIRRLGNGDWSADCDACPEASSLGWVTRPTHGLVMAWTEGHIRAHRQGPSVVYLARQRQEIDRFYSVVGR